MAKISAAVGTSANSVGNPALGQRIQQAMSDAVTAAHEAGVTDDAEVRELMLAAREAVKAE